MKPEDEARYLVDQEDFFQSADNFRAWFLAGQLQAPAQGPLRSGVVAQPGGGRLPQEVCGRTAMLRPPSEVAEAIGERGIAPDVLLLRLGTTLQVPIKLDAKTEGGASVNVPTGEEK